MPLTTKSLKGEDAPKKAAPAKVAPVKATPVPVAPESDAEPTKAEMAADASALEIEGRSGMTKSALAEALAGEPSTSLATTMDGLYELWRTVGFDSVNDQPVRNPTVGELETLAALLSKASDLVKMSQEKA